MFRKEPKTNATEFYDLDKIQTEAVAFRLNGKIHHIKPLTTLQFFQWTQAYQAFQALADNPKITIDELAEGYYKVFSSVINISREEARDCSQQQSAVLFGVILDAVTGKDDPASIKKKTFRMTPQARA